MAFLSKRFQYLNKKKWFPERSSGARGSSFRDKKDDPKVFFNIRSMDSLLLIILTFERTYLRRTVPRKRHLKT